MNQQSRLFVTGASGNLGRLTVESLLASGRTHVAAGSRDPSKLATLEEKGAEIREADFDRPETLRTAFAGIDRLLIVSTDAFDVPGKRIAQHRAAVEAAAAAGVNHLIYTSIPNASPGSAAMVARDHYETEQAIIASGIGYTILRNGLYADNLLPALPGIVASGKWFHAAGDGRVALVTREDCARIAAAALADGFQGKRILDVTGTDLLDHSETAAWIAAASGRQVEAVALPTEALVAGMVEAGLQPELAEVLASFDTAQARGEYDFVSDAVLELTGRKPVSLADFLKTIF